MAYIILHHTCTRELVQHWLWVSIIVWPGLMRGSDEGEGVTYPDIVREGERVWRWSWWADWSTEPGLYSHVSYACRRACLHRMVLFTWSYFDYITFEVVFLLVWYYLIVWHRISTNRIELSWIHLKYIYPEFEVQTLVGIVFYTNIIIWIQKQTLCVNTVTLISQNQIVGCKGRK